MSIDTACTKLAEWLIALGIELGERQYYKNPEQIMPTESAKEWDRVLVVKEALKELFKTWNKGATPGVHKSQIISSGMPLDQCVKRHPGHNTSPIREMTNT
jgi:hypothetical protein